MHKETISGSLPKKQITVQVSYLGHQTIIKEIDLSKTTEMNFVMHESNAMINEVVVTGLTGHSLMKDCPHPFHHHTQSTASHIFDQYHRCAFSSTRNIANNDWKRHFKTSHPWIGL